MRVRRFLALLVLLGATGLVVGLAFGLRDETGSARPVELSPEVAEAVPATAPVAAEEPEPESRPEPAETAPPALVYDAGARSVEIVPKLSARSYIAIDVDAGRVLVARRDRLRRPIASLTKVMTALLVIERGALDRKVRVPREATNVEPNKEGLRRGRWYTRRLLLYSALLVSANDSAATLAWDAGGGSVTSFYRLMNGRARELGMTDTTYRSASGLNDDTNLSSARDQAILARAALEEPVFARIVATERKRVKWPAPTYAKEWVNHNKMLVTYPGTYGVKTGYTAEAGGCLAVAVERDGHSVIAVVLGSENIWKDMPRLVDAAFERLG